MNKSILVVDDLKIITKIVEKYLLAAGYSPVYLASNGQQAIDMAREHKPDIIFLDIVMPVVTGTEALKIIRPELPDATIVMLTSLSEVSVAKQCKELGANGYILKGPKGVADEVLACVKKICAVAR